MKTLAFMEVVVLAVVLGVLLAHIADSAGHPTLAIIFIYGIPFLCGWVLAGKAKKS